MVALDAFSNEAKPLGLEVSWTNTKIQDFGDLLGEPVRSVHACCKNIEVTESFTYLGSVVHNSGLSDPVCQLTDWPGSRGHGLS